MKAASVLCRSQAPGGGGHDLAKFRIPMIHRFIRSHPVAESLLCAQDRLFCLTISVNQKLQQSQNVNDTRFETSQDSP